MTAPVGGECAACGERALEAVYELRGVPVHSCLMVPTREAALAFPTGDLSLCVCTRCAFLQNVAFDAGRLSYSPDYEETQSFSPHFRRFAERLCAEQIEKYDLRGKSALEIGCGKGEFLVELCEQGVGAGIGIDPGYRPERSTSPAAERIDFIRDLYSEAYAHLRADYVCCRHTLEHIQPVREFVSMVRRTLDDQPDAVVMFELPAAERILEEPAFWDVYYEHCSYFTLGSLARLFRACDFDLLDLYKDYDDQYLIIEARPGARPGGARFPAEDDLEATLAGARAFRGRTGQKIEELRDQLEAARRAGQRVVLWGSGSKAVSYLTTLDVHEELSYVVDVNPHKHGKFLAGTGHEIVAPAFLEEYRPDLVVAMNPVYRDEIQAELDRMGCQAQLTAI